MVIVNGRRRLIAQAEGVMGGGLKYFMNRLCNCVVYEV